MVGFADISIDPASVTAFVAIIACIFSVGFGLRGQRIQRIHNQKSVRPIGSITYEILSLDKLEIILNNSGLGPMIIKGINVLPLESIDESSKCINDVLKSNKNKIIGWDTFLLDFPNTGYDKINGEFSIRPDKPISILNYNLSEKPSEVESENFFHQKEEILEKLKNTYIIIQYVDIYDNKFNLIERYGGFTMNVPVTSWEEIQNGFKDFCQKHLKNEA